MKTTALSMMTLFLALCGPPACDPGGEGPSTRSSGILDASVEELEVLSLEDTADSRDARETMDRLLNSTAVASEDDYYDCVDDCGEELFACEYDILLSCVYQEPACGFPEICEIWLEWCLEGCETLYGTNGAGNGTGSPSPASAGEGTGEPTPASAGNGTGKPGGA